MPFVICDQFLLVMMVMMFVFFCFPCLLLSFLMVFLHFTYFAFPGLCKVLEVLLPTLIEYSPAHLFTIETNDSVISHRLLPHLLLFGLQNQWVGIIDLISLVLGLNVYARVLLLYEADHCLVAFWFELLRKLVIIGVLYGKGARSSNEWRVFRRWFQILRQMVPEVVYEPNAWLEFNYKALIIKVEPLSIIYSQRFNRLLCIYTLLIARFTIPSFCFKALSQFNDPNAFFLKWKLVILSDGLDFIRKCMGANFLGLE